MVLREGSSRFTLNVIDSESLSLPYKYNFFI